MEKGSFRHVAYTPVVNVDERHVVSTAPALVIFQMSAGSTAQQGEPESKTLLWSASDQRVRWVVTPPACPTPSAFSVHYCVVRTWADGAAERFVGVLEVTNCPATYVLVVELSRGTERRPELSARTTPAVEDCLLHTEVAQAVVTSLGVPEKEVRQFWARLASLMMQNFISGSVSHIQVGLLLNAMAAAWNSDSDRIAVNDVSPGLKPKTFQGYRMALREGLRYESARHLFRSSFNCVDESGRSARSTYAKASGNLYVTVPPALRQYFARLCRHVREDRQGSCTF